MMPQTKKLFLYFNIVVVSVEAIITLLTFTWSNSLNKISKYCPNLVEVIFNIHYFFLLPFTFISFIICLIVLIKKFNPTFLCITLSQIMFIMVWGFIIFLHAITEPLSVLIAKKEIKSITIGSCGRKIKVYELVSGDLDKMNVFDISIETDYPYNQQFEVYDLPKDHRIDTVRHFGDSLIMGSKENYYIRCDLKTGKYKKVYDETGKKLLE